MQDITPSNDQIRAYINGMDQDEFMETMGNLDEMEIMEGISFLETSPLKDVHLTTSIANLDGEMITNISMNVTMRYTDAQGRVMFSNGSQAIAMGDVMRSLLTHVTERING